MAGDHDEPTTAVLPIPRVVLQLQALATGGLQGGGRARQGGLWAEQPRQLLAPRKRGEVGHTGGLALEAHQLRARRQGG